MSTPVPSGGTLRPALGGLKRKLSGKDKRRIKKAKVSDAKKAMVKKSLKGGKVTVLLGNNCLPYIMRSIHAKSVAKGFCISRMEYRGLGPCHID